MTDDDLLDIPVFLRRADATTQKPPHLPRRRWKMPRSGRKCRRPKTSEDIGALEKLGYGAAERRAIDGHQAITIRLWSIAPSRWFARHPV